MKTEAHGVTVELVQGDITELDADAIVNAANSQLILGAGVAGAIRSKGGSSIQAECNKIGHCDVGAAVITGGGSLKARYVIHAVGPRMGEGKESEKLASATRANLQIAEENGLGSIAFPAISTGIFGYPLESCAEIMLGAFCDFAETAPANVKHIMMCLYDAPALEVFAKEFQRRLDF